MAGGAFSFSQKGYASSEFIKCRSAEGSYGRPLRWKSRYSMRPLSEGSPCPIHIELDETIDLSSERQEDLADDSYVEENSIDTDALINHEILIHFPMKVLCREDCRGICLKCGKNLNHGECGCDRVSPDPRMAAIQDIFKNFKEV